MNRSNLSDGTARAVKDCSHQRGQAGGDGNGVRGDGGQRRTYHIERIYLDSDEAYGFAQAFNGIAPVEPVQVEEWQIGAPPAAYDGQYWRAEWWARIPDSKRRSALRAHRRGRTLRRLRHPPRMVDRRGAPRGQAGAARTAGAPKIEVIGRIQGQSGGDLLGRGYPGQGRPGGHPEEIISAPSRGRWK